MKSLPIPEIEQLNALVSGSLYQLVSDYVENPSPALKKYLTINREILIGFLLKNPDRAEAYFQKQEQVKATHDVEKMWEENEEYIVASMDHGNARSVRRFKSLAEAVAEHVLVSYGMY
jgi:hypothetical protein